MKFIETNDQLPPDEFWTHGPMKLLVILKNHPPGNKVHVELWGAGSVGVLYFRMVALAWQLAPEVPKKFKEKEA
jgi:hypothetical protein